MPALIIVSAFGWPLSCLKVFDKLEGEKKVFRVELTNIGSEKEGPIHAFVKGYRSEGRFRPCLLYTSDAADE